MIRSAYGISYDMISGLGTGAQGFGTDGLSSPGYVNIFPANGTQLINKPFNDAYNGGGLVSSLNPQDPQYLGRSVTAILREQSRVPPAAVESDGRTRGQTGLNISVAYVGTAGRFITIQQHPLNNTQGIPWATLENARQVYMQTGANPMSQTKPNPYFGMISGNATLSAPNITVQNLSLPFPAYGSVTVFHQRMGMSSYNSLQSTIRKSFGHGVEVIGSYTFSKNLDLGESYAAAGSSGSRYYLADNMKLDRSISGISQPQRATVTWVAEMPFGRGKGLLKNTPVITQLVSGWKLAGVNTFASGLPIAVSGGGSLGRPDIVGDPVLPKEYRCIGDGVKACPLPDGTSVVVPIRRMLWFNPHAYSGRTINVPTSVGATTMNLINDPYWIGNAPRLYDGLRRLWQNNWNMTISRTFIVREGMKAELRCEALNAFNRVEWGSFDGGFGSPYLGRGTANGATTVGQSTSVNFGTIDMTANPARTPRYLQVSLRLSF